jgi:hypothetical protein
MSLPQPTLSTLDFSTSSALGGSLDCHTEFVLYKSSRILYTSLRYYYVTLMSKFCILYSTEDLTALLFQYTYFVIALLTARGLLLVTIVSIV